MKTILIYLILISCTRETPVLREIHRQTAQKEQDEQTQRDKRLCEENDDKKWVQDVGCIWISALEKCVNQCTKLNLIFHSYDDGSSIFTSRKCTCEKK